MLQLKNISFAYSSDARLLENCSLHLNPGNIYGLIGGPGVGKTTLFNIITRYLKPQSGTIIFNGSSIDNLSPFEVGSAGIGRTFQDMRLITNLTVRDHIRLSLKNRPAEGINSDAHVDEIAENTPLSNVLNKRVSELSHSLQKLIEFVCCISKKSSLLLLDEPTNGVSCDCSNIIAKNLIALKREGKAILIIDNNLGFITKIADKILLLSEGRLAPVAIAS